MEKLNIIDFQKRKLKKFYLSTYIITKDIKIRADTCISDRKLYVLFGYDFIGDRQILGMYFGNDNDQRFWLERFEEIQSKGVEKIMFFVTPKNKNIERCIKIVYNGIKIVHSPDEVLTSITRFLADRPSRKLKLELKNLFLEENIEKFKEELKKFKEIYVDNQIVKVLLDKKEQQIEEYYQYSKELREVFYPYYPIYEMKKYLNKIKTKEPLCRNINEVMEFCLPYINSFESGRSYSKADWLSLMGRIYANKEYAKELEEYIDD